MEKSEHKIELIDRREMSLSGVTDVKEFSEDRVSLKTTMGALLIKGRKLNISRLNTDTGALFISGDIDLIKYTSNAGGGMLEGLFK